MAIKENVNVTALLAGVTTLVSTVGALTATGILGRLQRNEPDAVIAAVVLVLLGGIMYVLGGLPLTRGRSETFANVLGSGLIVVGVGWALTAGVVVTGQRESPQVAATIAADGATVSGTVKVGNVASDRSLSLLVEGLRAVDDGPQKWQVFTLAQYYVGPDSNGNVELPFTVAIPAKTYESVGVKAWTDDEDTCGKYPRRVASEPFKRQVDVAGTGCVVLPLPAKVALPAVPAKTVPVKAKPAKGKAKSAKAKSAKATKPKSATAAKTGTRTAVEAAAQPARG